MLFIGVLFRYNKVRMKDIKKHMTTLFPRNFRVITEGYFKLKLSLNHFSKYSFSSSQVRQIKIFVVSGISLFLLMLIFLQGVTLFYQLKAQQSIAWEKAQVQREIAHWKGVADRYSGYRDVYYRIASLEYKAGNSAESQKYIKKALELDPNFPEGQVLGAKVGF
jgi:tetratricopeptide (TPR) repeat protein